MRASTFELRQKIIEAYEQVLNKIKNSDGKITLSNGATFNIKNSVRRYDIISMVASQIGTGHCDKTIERYVNQYITEKTKAKPE